MFMDSEGYLKFSNKNYLEAETVSEDSEISSAVNSTDRTLEISPFVEKIQKMKDLVNELEESFRECNCINNNLILRCVLLRAENLNLVHTIDQKSTLIKKDPNKQWKFCVICKKNNNKLVGGKEKRLISNDDCMEATSFAYDSAEEIELLHNTIKDLQKKLREKSTRFNDLSQKYSCLETNKNKMEIQLRSRITSLEEQLNVTNDTLSEFRDETEADIEETLSFAVDPHEALFLQEKLRCSKLMYEKVRLNHEIQSLRDAIRRLSFVNKEKDNRKRRTADFRPPLDKVFSEPYVRRN